MPSIEFLSEYYERYHRPGGEGGFHEEFEQRTADDFPRKAQIVSDNIRRSLGSRVLDVGCGKGWFVHELYTRNICAEGIDLSETAIAAGKKQGIPGLRSGRLEEQDDWDSAFDAVTCWATIEHLPDPKTFVRGIKRVLKPGGLLFVDTGIGNDLLDRCAPGFVQWYDPPQHIFVFSKSGLQRLLDDCGFEVVHFDGNFERSGLRRIAKVTRNYALALSCGALFRFLGGKAAYQKVRSEHKMPFGSLMLVIARCQK